ncbi:MAG: GNAT family N-acetyltransferase [Flavobacteriales bacterium]|nr:GNAT family N-acetyltransferase [Flavobacteriales bacterium]
MKYIFRSQRLGFRNWKSSDSIEFAKINADTEVMEHFPKPLNNDESFELLKKLQIHYKNYGYTYFATEILETGELIGFIGLAFQNYKTKFTPATDIGWRLKKEAWSKGYATEGALKCLDFGFNTLKLKRIISTCTVENIKSENVMNKIGMIKRGYFKHPELSNSHDLSQCVLYEIKKPLKPDLKSINL